MWKSTLPTTLSTLTWLGNPLTILEVGLLFSGKPVPSQLTAPDPDTVHPDIFWLAALIGTLFASKSAIAFGMLLPQSAEAAARTAETQVGVVPEARVMGTIDGLLTPPKELPTS